MPADNIVAHVAQVVTDSSGLYYYYKCAKEMEREREPVLDAAE